MYALLRIKNCLWQDSNQGNSALGSQVPLTTLSYHLQLLQVLSCISSCGCLWNAVSLLWWLLLMQLNTILCMLRKIQAMCFFQSLLWIA